MNNIMKKTLFTLCGLLAIPAVASLPYSFESGAPMTYELPANEPQLFINIFRWPVEATCSMLEREKESPLSFAVLKKKASVNDITLSSGDSLEMMVSPKDSFVIRAEPSAKVEITNHGEQVVVMRCYASSGINLYAGQEEPMN